MTEDVWRGQLSELETRIQQLEGQINGVLGVIAALDPVKRLLAFGEAEEDQQRAVYALADEMSDRLERGATVSFTEFEERVFHLVPHRRGERQFLHRLVEALRLERPSNKRLCEHLTASMALLRR